MEKKYLHSILGGTFDHFHTGHEFFLKTALDFSKKLTIGLTTEVLHKSKDLADSIQDFQTRKDAIEEYMEMMDPAVIFEIIPLTDIYGTTLKEENIEAIFTTEHGIANTNSINEKRLKMGWNGLEVELVSLVKGDDGQVVSSTRIRRGEIDRTGIAYMDLFSNNSASKISEEVRKILGEPFGPILKNNKEIKEALDGKGFIFSVGDVSSRALFDLGLDPQIAIVDQKTERGNFEWDSKIWEGKTILNAENRAGQINIESVRLINELIHSDKYRKGSTVIKVEGEEDLLALPLILFAPLGVAVCYGLRNKGMVVVRVTENMKRMILDLIKKFDG